MNIQGKSKIPLFYPAYSFNHSYTKYVLISPKQQLPAFEYIKNIYKNKQWKPNRFWNLYRHNCFYSNLYMIREMLGYKSLNINTINWWHIWRELTDRGWTINGY